MAFDKIMNFYEEKLNELISVGDLSLDPFDDDQAADILCLTLNQFPNKYIVHTIDMSYYTPIDEMMDIENRLKAAFEMAVEKVSENNEE